MRTGSGLEAVAAAAVAAVSAAAAAVAAAASASATAAAVATAAAAAAVFARAGFVDGQGAAVVLLAVERRDGGVGLGVIGHLHEPEALALAGVPVVDDLGGNHLPVLSEHLLQLRAIH